MFVPKVRWRDARRWEKWEPRVINGTRYAFDHLLDFDMTLSRPPRGHLPALRIPIRVVFDCHVVTESTELHSSDNPRADASSWVDSGGRLRRFNPGRYIRSFRLRTLIKGLTEENARCYVASAHNYMVYEHTTLEGSSEYYQVYFDLYRPSGEPRLVMYVQSAYVKDHPTAASRRHAKPFAMLCAEKVGAIPTKPKGNKKTP
ncbi:MAG TPA: hypothetical protein VGN46_02265 [Luteibacter sp.]|jgi:hypothetical protein|uniref:hypothetical protein n=1 Tax=Luteibacter sp. TaxID=1886636 RepID=UPI002F41E1E3